MWMFRQLSRNSSTRSSRPASRMAEEVLAQSAAEFGAAPGAVARAPKAWRWPLGLVLPVACVGAWQLVTGLGWVGADLLPSPLTVAQTILGMARAGSLWSNIGATAQRLVFGFLFGAAAATLAGALTGAS